MKASKFPGAGKAFILRPTAGGIPVAEICREAGSPAEFVATIVLETVVTWG